jgi:hypothetical protein
MSQHDLDIANQTASSARADINLALKALGSVNSGATAPATTIANMLWYDTANNALKMRAEANDAWISVGYLDQSADAFRIFDDTQVVNSAGSQTGLIGDQASSVWQTGTSTTESLVSPAKISSAIASLSSSGFKSVQVFTSSSTWNKPSGINKILMFVTGGGQGGSVPNQGEAAGTAIAFRDVSGITSATVTVGAGGAGVNVTSAGGSGGASTFSGAGSNVVGCAGGTGSSSGGDINLQSSDFKDNNQTGGNAVFQTVWPSGFWNTTFGVGGYPGKDPGSGANIVGGAGASGIVFVMEFE